MSFYLVARQLLDVDINEPDWNSLIGSVVRIQWNEKRIISISASISRDIDANLIDFGTMITGISDPVGSVEIYLVRAVKVDNWEVGTSIYAGITRGADGCLYPMDVHFMPTGRLRLPHIDRIILPIKISILDVDRGTLDAIKHEASRTPGTKWLIVSDIVNEHFRIMAATSIKWYHMVLRMLAHISIVAIALRRIYLGSDSYIVTMAMSLMMIYVEAIFLIIRRLNGIRRHQSIDTYRNVI